MEDLLTEHDEGCYELSRPLSPKEVDYYSIERFDEPVPTKRPDRVGLGALYTTTAGLALMALTSIPGESNLSAGTAEVANPRPPIDMKNPYPDFYYPGSPAPVIYDAEENIDVVPINNIAADGAKIQNQVPSVINNTIPLAIGRVYGDSNKYAYGKSNGSMLVESWEEENNLVKIKGFTAAHIIKEGKDELYEAFIGQQEVLVRLTSLAADASTSENGDDVAIVEIIGPVDLKGYLNNGLEKVDSFAGITSEQLQLLKSNEFVLVGFPGNLNTRNNEDTWNRLVVKNLKLDEIFEGHNGTLKFTLSQPEGINLQHKELSGTSGGAIYVVVNGTYHPIGIMRASTSNSKIVGNTLPDVESVESENIVTSKEYLDSATYEATSALAIFLMESGYPPIMEDFDNFIRFIRYMKNVEGSGYDTFKVFNLETGNPDITLYKSGDKHQVDSSYTIDLNSLFAPNDNGTKLISTLQVSKG